MNEKVVKRGRGRTRTDIPSVRALQRGLLVLETLGRGEEMLDKLYERIAAKTGVSGAVKVLKPGVSVPPEPADWARLTSEATVAITGFGG